VAGILALLAVGRKTLHDVSARRDDRRARARACICFLTARELTGRARDVSVTEVVAVREYAAA
jgi:hypothetical protein